MADDDGNPNKLCGKCGFRVAIYRANVCVPCFKELGRETRRALGRLVHVSDQIRARITEEGGEPTKDEWAALREIVGVDEDEERSEQDGDC